MWIRQLSVCNFAGIRSAELAFERGINVLYGPNEIGKSTLVEAIRAALLLPDGAAAARDFMDWHADHPPQVTLTFETEPQRVWRARKSFGKGSDGWSYLEFSRDGETFTQEAKGREVEGRIRELLRWGLAAPGGRGRTRGFSESFLATTLLADQATVSAVLGSGLEADADESGKRRLTEALQALAEDPLFRAVVAAAQDRVAEAFTSTGQRSRRRGSPWMRLREQRQAAERWRAEIGTRAAQSEDAHARAAELRDELNEARSQLDEARRRRCLLDAAWEQQQARAAAYEEIARAQQERDRIQSLHDARDKAARDLAAAETAVAAHAERLQAAAAAELQESARLEAARERLTRQESAAARQQRIIRTREIENRLLANRNRRTEHAALRTEACRVRDLEAVARRLRADVGAKSQALAEARSRVAQAAEQNRGDAAESSRIDARLLGVALLEARGRRDRARHAAREVEVLESRAADDARRAAALRRTVEELRLPGSQQLDRLRALQTDLRVAEEKLQVGISVEISPTGPLSFTARTDDGEPGPAATVTELTLLEAASRLSLELEDVGRITIRGGSRDARGHAERLRTEWSDATAALFQRLAVGHLEEALEKCRAGERRLAEAVDLERAAEQAGGKAAALAGDAVAVAEREREVERLECRLAADLGERDLEAFVRECAPGAGGGQALVQELEERRAAIARERERRDARTAELRQQVSRDGGIIEAWQNELTAQEDGLAERRQALADSWQTARAAAEPRRPAAAPPAAGSVWQTVLAHADAELKALTTSDRDLNEERAALQTVVSDELERTRTAVRQAEEGLASAQSQRGVQVARVESARQVRDRLAGEVEARTALVQQEDLTAARTRLDALRARLERLPAPETTTTVAERERIAQEQGSWTDECAARQAELQKAEGALQQVGGHAIQEQRAQADEAVRAIGRREREVEIEYDAWKLLLEILREAEAEAAAHLGKALVEPVSQRVAELTGGAYGAVEIDPALSTRSIEVAGNQRQLSRLSVGTRDQVATVLRLTIAEKLGSTVVLDDQMVQSDASRMRWLRAFMTDCAREIQILVLTCHPEHYQVAAGSPLHAIDLAEHLERTR